MTSTIASTYTATAGGADIATTETFEVIDPATGAPFATAPAVGPDALDTAFGAAASAFTTWRRDEDHRRDRMRAAADTIDAHIQPLADLLTREQGKPLADATAEVAMTTGWLRYFAELDLPRQVVQDDANGYTEVFRRPLGVVAAITPWNFPLLLAMWKIAPALRSGNTLVVKPSPYTPLTTLEVGRILRGVLPDGVLNVVSGPDPLGASMVAHPAPRKVSFTGSTATGIRVARSAADDLKRLTLELGGNDPAIVLDDVDVPAVAESLFWSGFMNNGQVCLAAKRIYAHERIREDLVEALAGVARGIVVDTGTVAGVHLGPVNNRPQYERVRGLVDDAVAHGGRIAAGGAPLDREGYFYAPTIIDGVSDGVRLVDEEQFGPALPVVPVVDEADAVARANASPYGLTASVWSADPDRARAVAADLDTGQVSVNAHGTAVLPHLPFGGHKHSGLGVENGPWGLEGYTELQVITSPGRSSG